MSLRCAESTGTMSDIYAATTARIHLTVHWNVPLPPFVHVATGQEPAGAELVADACDVDQEAASTSSARTGRHSLGEQRSVLRFRTDSPGQLSQGV